MKQIIHIDAPAGSGKNHILDPLSVKYPHIAFKDLDEFDDVAKVNLNINTLHKPEWKQKDFDRFYKHKNKLLDKYLKENKDKHIVLFGIHSEGINNSSRFNIPKEATRIRINVSPDRSVYRRKRRDRITDRKQIEDMKKEALDHIKFLDTAGYKSMLPSEIRMFIKNISREN